MAEKLTLMWETFKMNDTFDMVVLVLVYLYFVGVIGGWIYCCKKWRKEDDEKRQGGPDHRHGRQARR